LLTILLTLVGVVVIFPLVALTVLNVPATGVVLPITVLSIVPPLNAPPVTVLPVKVSELGKDSVGVAPPDEVISFAVPDTLVTGVAPEDAAVSCPCALTVKLGFE
jgi:hypothetical protein